MAAGWLGDTKETRATTSEIDHITVHTTTRGTGSGTRHTLEGADMSFLIAGGVPSKSNPQTITKV